MHCRYCQSKDYRVKLRGWKIRKENQSCCLATCLLVVLLAFSGMQPYDRPTWLLEVFPILIALPLLVWTYQRFPLTNLLCPVVSRCVLMLGAYYTYARVPLGFDLAALLDINRNPYDKGIASEIR